MAEAKKRESDRKITYIIVGVVLVIIVVVALILLLSKKDKTPFEEKTTQERLAETKSQEQSLADRTNYEAAKTLLDRKYCNFIVNDDLKKKCISEVPEKEPLKDSTSEKSTLSEDALHDKTNYEAAKALKEKKYCALIINDDLRIQCEQEIK
jgi:hypothetical protein